VRSPPPIRGDRVGLDARQKLPRHLYDVQRSRNHNTSNTPPTLSGLHSPQRFAMPGRD
jgi:hypothetical protein